ncbi:MAG TPA: hypothetical protein VEH06_05435 [Candidatus Bathyarchaeia archaeon]|nr:hypothetical protein [Candidatus Bathyarchaeia archaeon]
MSTMRAAYKTTIVVGLSKTCHNCHQTGDRKTDKMKSDRLEAAR